MGSGLVDARHGLAFDPARPEQIATVALHGILAHVADHCEICSALRPVPDGLQDLELIPLYDCQGALIMQAPATSNVAAHEASPSARRPSSCTSGTNESQAMGLQASLCSQKRAFRQFMASPR